MDERSHIGCLNNEIDRAFERVNVLLSRAPSEHRDQALTAAIDRYAVLSDMHLKLVSAALFPPTVSAAGGKVELPWWAEGPVFDSVVPGNPL